METNLASLMNDIAASSGVKGVLAIDKQGLCIAASGLLGEKDAGRISAIVRTAGSLEADSQAPMICIKYEKRDLLIHQSAGVILAVLRSNVTPAS